MRAILPVVAITLLSIWGQDKPPSTLSDEARPGLAELREHAELDRVARLVPRGRELVRGPLAASGEARALVARALFDAGLEDEADELLAVELDSPTARAWVTVGRAGLAFARDRLDAAARLLREADAPGEAPPRPELAALPEAWILLARIEARAGHPLAAAHLAQGFLERAPLHPEAPIAWHLLAQEALDRRDGQAAGRYLERARQLEQWLELLHTRRMQVRRHPDEPLPRLGLGLVWMQAGEAARAREVLSELTDAHPDFARGWFHLGESARAMGDAAGARAAYDRALEADPDQHLARFNRAMLDLAEGVVGRAREGLERLAAHPEVQEDGRLAPVFLELARLELAAGERARADELYERYRGLGGTETLSPR